MQTVKEGNWQIEKYGQEEAFHHSVPSDALLHEAVEYESLGLTTLADRSMKLACATDAKVSGKVLSVDEIAIWSWRDPTAYSTAVARQDDRTIGNLPQRLLAWNRLTWPVPQEVRQIVHQSLPCFDRLEIWTPEWDTSLRIGPSPILMGCRGNRATLLARWAEALEPWEKIVQKAKSRYGREARRLRIQHHRREGGGPICAGVFFFLLTSVVSSA